MAPYDKHTFSGGLSKKGEKKKELSGCPLVTIITIVLNDEKHIRKTLESVLNQSYKPIEYIVIDGGSTDNTISILRQYEKMIDYWLSEPDEGISEAFNKGIKVANGQYIGLINSGDWYEPGTVEEVVETFKASPDTGVICGALQFWDGLKREYVCYSAPHLLEKDMTITHPTCFVRSDLYDCFGLYESEYKFAMDYKLLLRLKKQGIPFISLRSILANMQHSGISEEHWREALQETHRARIELLGSSFFASKAYYYFVECKRRIRILLQKMGMNMVISFYRSRLALVKKKKV